MRRRSITNRTIGWLAVAGLVAGALAAPVAVTAAPLDGAIWTSLSDGTSVNANIYANKSDVYLNGGPQNCGNGNGLPDGDYYFQVTDPSGATLLSTDAIKYRQVEVVNEVIAGVSGDGNHLEGATGCNGGTPVQLMPYNDTPNNGGEYSVDLAPVGEVQACEGFSADSATFNFLDCNTSSKNDNFKVGEQPSTPPSAPPSNPPSDPPSAPPSDPPSAPPSASPTPAPREAVIFVTKLLDVDGDASTTDDLVEGPGWTFTITVEGGVASDDSVTTDENGEAGFDVTLTGEGTSVSITESVQEGFEILWADCAEVLEEGFGEPFGTLDGETLSFEIQAQTTYDCIFANTGGDVLAETATPGVTPPPTDTVRAARASADGSRLFLLALAGVIATLLVLTPAPAARRRR